MHCYLLTEAVSQYSGSYCSQQVRDINDSSRYFFDAILFSLKDCKQNLISMNKLGIKLQEICLVQVTLYSKRLQRFFSEQLCKFFLAVFFQVLLLTQCQAVIYNIYSAPKSPRKSQQPPGELLDISTPHLYIGKCLPWFQLSQPKMHLPIFTLILEMMTGAATAAPNVPALSLHPPRTALWLVYCQYCHLTFHMCKSTNNSEVHFTPGQNENITRGIHETQRPIYSPAALTPWYLFRCTTPTSVGNFPSFHFLTCHPHNLLGHRSSSPHIIGPKA